MIKNSKTEIEYRLKAISLLDGRNRDKVDAVSDYFSEFALIKYRVKVEVEYLIFLSQKTNILRKLKTTEVKILRKIPEDFFVDDAVMVKEYERKSNHDVKSVEYFLREKFTGTSLEDVSEFIHFGLTSYDINIPAYGLMIADFRKSILLPVLLQLTEKIRNLVKDTASMIMLGRTHGQPALPTTMGKEIAVFLNRISTELKILQDLPVEGKLTGAVGNFNALHFVSSGIDWISFSKNFILSLGLEPNLITTQILPYDSWLRIFDSIKRINYILLGFVQDIWWYISFEYFLQKNRPNEVGSSTMSQKINPITFENAEGNLGYANSQIEYFVRKLSYSRLQRDLSDSTIKRDFGLMFGFSLLAYDSILSGLSGITPNSAKMEKDLDCHWEIFSECIQTYMKYKGMKDAFEIIKDKTRGLIMDRKAIYELIDSLPLKESETKRLKIKSLKEYSGLAEKLAGEVVKKT